MGILLVPLYALIEDGTKVMNKEGLRETRKQMFAQMEQRLQEMHPKEEDRMFYYHSSEDRVVLSHALFWVMTQPQCLKGKIRKERFFLLLRQYEEEMLDAFLMEDDYFPELLRSQDLRNERPKVESCNILFEMLPTILMSTGLRADKDARKLAAIAVVAAGYGGDMDEELCDELLDDMDFHYNKVKCRKIEGMLPKLMKMVEGEMKSFSQRGNR